MTPVIGTTKGFYIESEVSETTVMMPLLRRHLRFRPPVSLRNYDLTLRFIQQPFQSQMPYRIFKCFYVCCVVLLATKFYSR